MTPDARTIEVYSKLAMHQQGKAARFVLRRKLQTSCCCVKGPVTNVLHLNLRGQMLSLRGVIRGVINGARLFFFTKYTRGLHVTAARKVLNMRYTRRE